MIIKKTYPTHIVVEKDMGCIRFNFGSFTMKCSHKPKETCWDPADGRYVFISADELKPILDALQGLWALAVCAGISEDSIIGGDQYKAGLDAIDRMLELLKGSGLKGSGWDANTFS